MQTLAIAHIPEGCLCCVQSGKVLGYFLLALGLFKSVRCGINQLLQSVPVYWAGQRVDESAKATVLE